VIKDLLPLGCRSLPKLCPGLSLSTDNAIPRLAVARTALNAEPIGDQADRKASGDRKQENYTPSSLLAIAFGRPVGRERLEIRGFVVSHRRNDAGSSVAERGVNGRVLPIAIAPDCPLRARYASASAGGSASASGTARDAATTYVAWRSRETLARS
jgi:hypothetical protein